MATRRSAGPSPARPIVETTVFRSGNSDAVRLPKHYAMHGQRVRLRPLSDGSVLIEPTRRRRWPPGFLESLGRVTKDFEAPARPTASRRADARAAALFGRRRSK